MLVDMRVHSLAHELWVREREPSHGGSIVMRVKFADRRTHGFGT
jgi:hypothetical protein